MKWLAVILVLASTASADEVEPQIVPPTLLEGQRIEGSVDIQPDDADKVAMYQQRIGRVAIATKLCLDPGGNVSSVSVIKSSGLLGYDAKVQREQAAWKYRPYEVNGAPVPICTGVTIVYNQNVERVTEFYTRLETALIGIFYDSPQSALLSLRLFIACPCYDIDRTPQIQTWERLHGVAPPTGLQFSREINYLTFDVAPHRLITSGPHLAPGQHQHTFSLRAGMFPMTLPYAAFGGGLMVEEVVFGVPSAWMLQDDHDAFFALAPELTFLAGIDRVHVVGHARYDLGLHRVERPTVEAHLAISPASGLTFDAGITYAAFTRSVPGQAPVRLAGSEIVLGIGFSPPPRAERHHR